MKINSMNPINNLIKWQLLSFYILLTSSIYAIVMLPSNTNVLFIWKAFLFSFSISVLHFLLGNCVYLALSETSHPSLFLSPSKVWIPLCTDVKDFPDHKPESEQISWPVPDLCHCIRRLFIQTVQTHFSLHVLPVPPGTDYNNHLGILLYYILDVLLSQPCLLHAGKLVNS